MKNDSYIAYLKGYAVACTVFSMSLLVYPIPELVEALGGAVTAGVVLFAMGRVKGFV
jgi:hypothetical protein